MTPELELRFRPSPDGHKVEIPLEDPAPSHAVHAVPIRAGHQPATAEFAARPRAAQIDRAGPDRAGLARISRRSDAMAARPGVVRGMAVVAGRTSPPVTPEAERDRMFPDRRAG